MTNDLNNVDGQGLGIGIDVCVVEDEDDLREATVLALRELGFRVRGVPASRELYRSLLAAPCDVVVLDLGLPGEDGLTVACHLKEITRVGIVILTARSDTDDRVRGLMGGADAYLVKPVDFLELAATVRSLARRLGAGDSTPAPAGGAGWQLILEGWSLVAPSGVQISLSPSERVVMSRLMRERDLPVSRDALIAALGHDTEYYDAHRLDMLISRLRRKVLEAAGTPLPLRAVRGVGFAFSSTGGQG